MDLEENRRQFFLGANTPQGFVNRFDQLARQEDGWRCFVIKGGPGCGKSTLLRKVAQAFEGRYEDMEYIRCSSDVDSLDAIVFPELKVAIADGTPPHDIARKAKKVTPTSSVGTYPGLSPS